MNKKENVRILQNVKILEADNIRDVEELKKLETINSFNYLPVFDFCDIGKAEEHRHLVGMSSGAFFKNNAICVNMILFDDWISPKKKTTGYRCSLGANSKQLNIRGYFIFIEEEKEKDFIFDAKREFLSLFMKKDKNE